MRGETAVVCHGAPIHPMAARRGVPDAAAVRGCDEAMQRAMTDIGRR